MIITYLRSSSYGTHEFCPMKWAISYLLGVQEDPNPKTILGTKTHKVMEILAKIKKTIQNNETLLNDEIVGQIDVNNYDFEHILDTVFEHYYQNSEIHKNRTKRLIDKGYHPDNFDLIFRKDYCEKDFFLKQKFQRKEEVPENYPDLAQTLKDLTKNTELLSISELIDLYKEADKKKYKTWVNRAITWDNGKFDPRNTDIIDAEIRFDIEIQEPWAAYDYGEGLQGLLALKGTIDQVSKINDTTYEIRDWKTGARIDWATGETKTYEKLQDDFQLRLYHYVIHRLFPNVDNIFVTIFFINDGGPFTLCFQKSDLTKTLEMVKLKYEEIKNTEIPARRITWKCKSFCHFGRHTFEGTHIKPIIEFRPGQLAKVGEPMKMCCQTAYCMENRPMESVIKNMSAKSFDYNEYKAPGE